MKATNFNMMCFVIFATLIFMVLFYPGGAHAQEVCTPEEKPHYYVATGTAKNGTSALRTFGLVSPEHKDLAACNEGLEVLRSQTGIAPKGGILANQSVSYEGFCIATEICP